MQCTGVRMTAGKMKTNLQFKMLGDGLQDEMFGDFFVCFLIFTGVVAFSIL